MKYLLACVLAMLALPAMAADVTLTWTAAERADGYRLAYLTHDQVVAGEQYFADPAKVVDVGNVLTYDWTGLPDGEDALWFACRAYNSAGESGDSNTPRKDYTAPVPPADLAAEETITVGLQLKFQEKSDVATAEIVWIGRRLEVE